MSELMLRNQRYPILVDIPGCLCEVPECENVRKVDMVVLFLQENRLEIFQICAHHAFLWKCAGGALFFPLNQTPSLQWIAREVEKELARRRPPSVVYHNVFNNRTTSYTSNIFFRFQ